MGEPGSAATALASTPSGASADSNHEPVAGGAINEGLRCKKRLWRAGGRQQLESFPLAPWASRRRSDLLELLDQLNPKIAELSQAIEREAETRPEAQRLRTHPGVGALTALAFVLIIGDAGRFQCGKHCRQSTNYLGRTIWLAELKASRHCRRPARRPSNSSVPILGGAAG